MRKQTKDKKKRPFNQHVPAPIEGNLVIIDDRCKGCGFCVEFCPKDVLFISDKFNVKGYHPPEMDPSKECVMCGLCELICPEFAIYSEYEQKPQKKNNEEKE